MFLHSIIYDVLPVLNHLQYFFYCTKPKAISKIADILHSDMVFETNLAYLYCTGGAAFFSTTRV